MSICELGDILAKECKIRVNTVGVTFESYSFEVLDGMGFLLYFLSLFSIFHDQVFPADNLSCHFCTNESGK